MALTGTLTADFSSFRAAVDSAVVQLKEFESDANKVTRALRTASDSLSGNAIVQQATIAAEAVERIGGVSKLTEAELARIGSTAIEAAAKLTAMGKDVPPGIQAIADAAKAGTVHTDSFGVSFGKLVLSYISAQAIIGLVKEGFHAFVGEIESSIKAAGDAEKAHVQMAAALKAQGTAVPSVISAFLGYADALQQTTIYQDDAVEGAIALLVQVGNVMPRDMQTALKATTDLASGLGIDLQSATMMVAKAAEGHATALGKVGVQVTDTGGKALSFGQILDNITEKFGGQAEAIAGTYQGRLTQLSNTWNNVEESIGRVITQNATVLGAINILNRGLSDNTGELNASKTANDLVSEAILGGVKALSFMLEAVDYVQTAYQGLRVTSNTLISALLNIGITVLDVVQAFNTYTRYVNPAAWTAQWRQGMAEAAELSTYLKGAVDGLSASSLDAIDTSARWGNAIQTLRAGVDHFGEQLEATRGKTLELNLATDKGTDAWDRQTKAVIDGKAAGEALAKQQAEQDAILMSRYQTQIKALEAQTAASLKAYSFEAQIANLGALADAEEALARTVFGELTSEQDRMKVLEDMGARRQKIDADVMALEVRHAGLINDQVIAELAAKTKLLAAYGENADGTLKMVDADKILEAALAALHAKKQEGIDQSYQEQLLMNQWVLDVNAQTGAVTTFGTTAKQGFETAQQALARLAADSFTSFATIGAGATAAAGKIDELGRSINQTADFAKKAHDQEAAFEAQKFTLPPGAAGVNPFTGAGQSTTSPLVWSYLAMGYTIGEAASLAIGKGGNIGPAHGHWDASGWHEGRAFGGAVDAGSTYMVGERGPELFRPGVSGVIDPNPGRGGAPIVITINVTQPLGSPQAIAQAAGDAFVTRARALGLRLPTRL